MARKKKYLVKDILNLFTDDSHEVCCMLYAYGVYYADTIKDGMKTVKDCKENMNYDCINAMVTGIRFDENDLMIIQAEIVH